MTDKRHLCDDTRTLKAGDTFVWDDRNKPGMADKLFAEAKAKGAAHIISNVKAEGVEYAEQPGEVLARWAAQHWPRQPAKMLGVTGTSGKTSVAWFAQQLAAACKVNAASVGTLGVVRNSVVEEYTGYTSPSALQLHPRLQKLAEEKVQVCALEVSSHALDLRRVEGVNFAAAGLTNITQDHLDFHGTLEAYAAAKLRLFSEVLPENGTAVFNITRPESWPAAAIAKQRGLHIITTGTGNAELVAEVVRADARGLELKLKFDAVPVPVNVPLVGGFQAENLAMSLGLLLGAGLEWKQLAKAAAHVTSVPGRMELTAIKNKPTVVVDYAHKPDALQRALESLRPITSGKLWVVFGCGGNRDATKRPMMGAIAAKLADEVIVTDDNPRFENAADIRKAVLAGAGGAQNFIRDIGDRQKAIAYAIENAKPNDVILVAGKGHEDGQIVQGETLPFDDRLVVREILA
ncbi:MAG TPA: UDP-N-acetylmuramoyl-L-alanyl-D-glutamate--2,6-diaminopimelate ligase [Alphaproteobacteria bacterium]|nr:UDP-N-acetylmuramoyl-L-alanyl-D-glutamate--2,6-diaminopimelate ligase [Alphaproteobacteria bacterium]